MSDPAAAATAVETIWEAQRRQAQALTCPVDELLFGGARGGGKSDWLLMDFAQDVPLGTSWRGILFRKSYPELEDLIARSEELYPRIFPGARWNRGRHAWTFPTGALLRLRFAETVRDVAKYQGHAYPWVGFDELPNWPDDSVYQAAFGFNRPFGDAERVRCRIRATGNPGGPGTLWVKDRFVFAGPW